MITAIIRWSIENRFLVLVVTALLTAWGIYSLRQTPIDAIPDLSDVQVIVKTAYPGQAPQVVEDQVTYPLTTALLAVPGAVTVRGYSFFGDSYVYIIFEDGTDLYWARSRASSNTLTRYPVRCQKRRDRRLVPTLPALAGSSSMRLSIEQGSTILPSFEASRIGF